MFAFVDLLQWFHGFWSPLPWYYIYHLWVLNYLFMSVVNPTCLCSTNFFGISYMYVIYFDKSTSPSSHFHSTRVSNPNWVSFPTSWILFLFLNQLSRACMYASVEPSNRTWIALRVWNLKRMYSPFLTIFNYQ